VRPPRASTVITATYAVVALLALVAAWNAAQYPPGQGYDASHHIDYAERLRAGDGVPEGTGEYYTPPGFYAVAAVALEAGDRLGLGEPLRVVQLVNAFLLVGTALLLLALARELFPGRPVLHLAAVGFLAGSAVAVKAAAMVHPETLDLFLSTLGLLLAARLLTRAEYQLPAAALLGVVLGAGQLVRAFALWTFAVVLLAFLAGLLVDRQNRRRILLAGAVVFAGAALVAGPWYVHQAQRYSNPVFDRPTVAKPLWERRPAAFYLDPGVPKVVTRPYRPSYVNRFWPTLYSEAWGDYFGVYGWPSHDREEPTRAEHRELVAQSVVGLLPTAFAGVGWLWLLARTLRRLRLAFPRLLVGLLPFAGLAGMLYFTVSYPTPDGDVIKGSYMLTTLPAWALAFALVVERLGRTRLALPLALLLAAAALVSLRFALYGSPLGGLL
jgi:hypothetical protein